MARRSVFISYARQDRDDVEASAELLRAGGVRVFIDVLDIEFGERWQDALRLALEKCERVMVFWSIAARASRWVDAEWRYAMSLGKKIVPTLLDDTPLPEELGALQALVRKRRTPAVAPEPNAPRPTEAPGGAARRWGGRRLAPYAAIPAAVALGVGAYSWMATTHPPQAPPEVVLPAPAQTSPAPPVDSTPLSALALLRRAGELPVEHDSTAHGLDDTTRQLRHTLDESRLGRYGRADLDELATAAHAALARNEEVQRALDAGRGRFDTPDEARAFKDLVNELVATSARIEAARHRLGDRRPDVVPPLPPASAAEADVMPGGAARAAWLAAALLALIGLTLAAGKALRRGVMARRDPEAARFVAQVFSV